MKILERCRPVWGSCNLPAGHKGGHNAYAKTPKGVLLIFRCGACGKRIAKNITWCRHCGANDDDE